MQQYVPSISVTTTNMILSALLSNRLQVSHCAFDLMIRDRILYKLIGLVLGIQVHDHNQKCFVEKKEVFL